MLWLRTTRPSPLRQWRNHLRCFPPPDIVHSLSQPPRPEKQQSPSTLLYYLFRIRFSFDQRMCSHFQPIHRARKGTERQFGYVVCRVSLSNRTGRCLQSSSVTVAVNRNLELAATE